jgi:hypothetical protein
VKIDKKIVGYKVMTKDEKEKLPAEAVTRQSLESMPRPDMLAGSTYKIKPPGQDHAMYITINDICLPDSERRPYEIFINTKNPEHFQWMLALTRVISAVLRKGGDYKFLIEELSNVFDPQGGYFRKGRYIPSFVAEIGRVIELHVNGYGSMTEHLDAGQKKFLREKAREFGIELNQQEGVSSANFPSNAKLCLKCNTKAVLISEGCATCFNCGDSKCG